jgi:signal peptidase
MSEESAVIRSLGEKVATCILVVTLAVVFVPAIGLLSGRWRVAPVLSGSMEPAIRTGSVVVLTPEPVGAVRPGQVIMYRIPIGDHHLELHRVVRVVSGGSRPVVITQGDANEGPDPWQAKLDAPLVWRQRLEFPWLGRMLLMLGLPLARALCLAVIVFIVVLAGLRWIWSPHHSDPSKGVGDDAPANA